MENVLMVVRYVVICMLPQRSKENRTVVSEKKLQRFVLIRKFIFIFKTAYVTFFVDTVGLDTLFAILRISILVIFEIRMSFLCSHFLFYHEKSTKSKDRIFFFLKICFLKQGCDWIISFDINYVNIYKWTIGILSASSYHNNNNNKTDLIEIIP